MKYMSWHQLGIVSEPGVMFLPTDTVYGLHARINDADAVHTLKTIKERNDERYFITLISQWEHVEECDIVLSDRHRRMLEQLWPGPYTVLLPDQTGQKSSFRWPHKTDLLGLIDQQGPLYSTSANRHGDPTVTDPTMLDDRLRGWISYGVDEGECVGSSSVIIDIVR